jgi:hypothetical protein
MTEELTEIDKKTLREYYDRILKTSIEFKYLQLKFLWDFIHNCDSFRYLCDSIKSSVHPGEVRHYNIVDHHQRIPLPENHFERVKLLYVILEQIVSPNHDINTMSQIARNYASIKQGSETIFFELFNDLFLEPFVFYLINQTNRKVVIIDLIKKYKHRSEWFNKDTLNEIAKTDTQKTEHYLKRDLYRFLFDHGLNLSIEPTSPSGEIDFIAAQKNSTNKLLAEGKVYDGVKRNKKYIQDGIWQLLTYLKDHNENEGYLIIYSISSSKTLSFDFKNEIGANWNCILQNKRIFIFVIDINIYDKSAQKRGQVEIDTIDYSCLGTAP